MPGKTGCDAASSEMGAPKERWMVAKRKLDLWSTALVFNKGHRIGV